MKAVLKHWVSSVGVLVAVTRGFRGFISVVIFPPYTFAIPFIAAIATRFATSAHRKWLISNRNYLAAKYGERSADSQRYGDVLTWYREKSPLYWVLAFFACLLGLACALPILA